MDAARFDTLARSLSEGRSRRGAMAAALGGALGVAGLTPADAKKKKPCPPCKKRKKGKCKGTLPDGTGCSGGTCQSGNCAPPSCTDGVKNASETGVDCGGPGCPRCANGQGCASRNDCRSAMCNLQINICEQCTTSDDCGEDSSGLCSCYTTVQGANICGKGTMPDFVTSCTLCPAPNFCWQPSPTERYCVRQCGA